VNKFSNIRAVIIDFEFTLSSDYYFRELGSQYTQRITELVFSRDSEIGRRWMSGLATSEDVAGYLSDHLDTSEKEVYSALVQGCSRMSFNQAVWDFAKSQKAEGKKLALVTVNADIFRRVIVPSHGLEKEFYTIVSSSDFRAEHPSKQPLWDAAFDNLGSEFGYANSLLIEDTRREVELFRKLGGTAYRYRNDSGFDNWIASKQLITEYPG
jgi:FMN phosphatase YigB (HAD superfamily)